MIDDHIFKEMPFSGINFHIEGSDVKTSLFVICKYCGYETFKNSIGEYLMFGDIVCLSSAEKMIKDLLE